MATRKKAPPAPKFASVAEMIRTRILEGKDREAIEGEVRKLYPNYKPWKIAYRVYEKELKAKGELPADS
jgi:hypothetical protein